MVDPSNSIREKIKVDKVHGELTRGMTVVEFRHYSRVKESTYAEIISQVDGKRFLRLIIDGISGD